MHMRNECVLDMAGLMKALRRSIQSLLIIFIEYCNVDLHSTWFSILEYIFVGESPNTLIASKE